MNAAARGKMVRHMLIALVVASLISVAIATSSSAAFSVEKPARKLMATTSSGAETAAAIIAPANIMAIANPAHYFVVVNHFLHHCCFSKQPDAPGEFIG